MDESRLIVGVATVFNQRAVGGAYWEAEQFHAFLSMHIGVPLRIDHGPIWNSRGAIFNVGTARHFASVAYPVRGLLCLAEIDHAEGYGDSLLADIDSILRQQWLPSGWGMSLGANTLDGVTMPFEVSVTRSPGFSDARILAVGARALSTWRFLSEENVRTAS
jgi:hypothetical protein